MINFLDGLSPRETRQSEVKKEQSIRTKMKSTHKNMNNDNKQKTKVSKCIRDFIHCCRSHKELLLSKETCIDRYLMAVGYIYLKRSKLDMEEYFLPALYLAWGMWEDSTQGLEYIKEEVLNKTSYHSFQVALLRFLNAIDYRTYVEEMEVEEIIEILSPLSRTCRRIRTKEEIEMLNDPIDPDEFQNLIHYAELVMPYDSDFEIDMKYEEPLEVQYYYPIDACDKYLLFNINPASPIDKCIPLTKEE